MSARRPAGETDQYAAGRQIARGLTIALLLGVVALGRRTRHAAGTHVPSARIIGLLAALSVRATIAIAVPLGLLVIRPRQRRRDVANEFVRTEPPPSLAARLALLAFLVILLATSVVVWMKRLPCRYRRGYRRSRNATAADTFDLINFGGASCCVCA